MPLFAMLSLLCSPAAAYSLSRQPFARPAVQVRTLNTQMSGRVHTPGLGGIKVDAKKTAVVFIEYQNEFTTEGGKLHEAVKGCAERHGDTHDTTINNARSLYRVLTRLGRTAEAEELAKQYKGSAE